MVDPELLGALLGHKHLEVALLVPEIYTCCCHSPCISRPPTNHFDGGLPLASNRSINSMAESVVGLYKIECVLHESAFGGVDGLKLATLFWSPGLRHTRRARSGLLPHQYRGKVEVVRVPWNFGGGP
jgi:hypothetical protein